MFISGIRISQVDTFYGYQNKKENKNGTKTKLNKTKPSAFDDILKEEERKLEIN